MHCIACSSKHPTKKPAPTPACATKTKKQQQQQQQKNKEKTTFLDLPAELRNDIYSLTLIKNSNFPIRTLYKDIKGLFGKYHSVYILSPADLKNAAEPPLLRASRQIRSETLPIFYGANIWRFQHLSAMEMFAAKLPPSKLELFREMKIDWYPVSQAIPDTLWEAVVMERKMKRAGFENAVAFVRWYKPEEEAEQSDDDSEESEKEPEKWYWMSKEGVVCADEEYWVRSNFRHGSKLRRVHAEGRQVVRLDGTGRFELLEE